mgnify:FL=1
MKNFDLKFALKKRWPELTFAFIWLLIGLSNTEMAIDSKEWVDWFTAACGYVCTIYWVFIFYKRAKQDGA